MKFKTLVLGLLTVSGILFCAVVNHQFRLKQLSLLSQLALSTYDQAEQKAEQKAKSNICIVMALSDGYQSEQHRRMYIESEASHVTYAKRHGYKIFVQNITLPADQNVAYLKIWALQSYVWKSLIEGLCEWIFYTDADTLVMDPTIPLETFLPPPTPEYAETSLLWAKDANDFNAGVFFLKPSWWAYHYLQRVATHPYYMPEEDHTFEEQSAMASLAAQQEPQRAAIEVPYDSKCLLTHNSALWFNPYVPGYVLAGQPQGTDFDWNMSFHLHIVSFSKPQWPEYERESHSADRWGGNIKQSRIRQAVEDFYASRLES